MPSLLATFRSMLPRYIRMNLAVRKRSELCSISRGDFLALRLNTVRFLRGGLGFGGRVAKPAR